MSMSKRILIVDDSPSVRQVQTFVLSDAGYDVIRLSYLLADLPVLLVARVRSDRVMRGHPPAVRADGQRAASTHLTSAASCRRRPPRMTTNPPRRWATHSR